LLWSFVLLADPSCESCEERRANAAAAPIVTTSRRGAQLRRFREQRGLTQAGFAAALGISPSYANQMESNQRPITVPVLLKLSQVFDADPELFAGDETNRLAAQLQDVLSDPSFSPLASAAEAREVAAGMPAVGSFLVELHRRYRHLSDRYESLAAHLDPDRSAVDAAARSATTAYEEVRDLFYAHRNYFPALDAAAEAIAAEAGLEDGSVEAGLRERLAQRHATTVVDLDPEGEGQVSKRRFDPESGVLALSPALGEGQRAFQLGTHLAFVELGEQIEQVLRDADFADAGTRELARIGLANYAAGAMILPYRRFRAAAEAVRYDVDLLGQKFRVGFETVAHRLSTLQRPRARGVPFIFVRVDRAGNISKRQSATSFHFSRVGGSCPLWVIHEAFATPGQLRTQLAQMPDGRGYLWVTRTVTHRGRGYRSPDRTLAVALGCDLAHAGRLVYADGLDLTNPSARTPIGPGCKVCDRTDCRQRAFPAFGQPLTVEPSASSFTPYSGH
jgi:hypothetical protein